MGLEWIKIAEIAYPNEVQVLKLCLLLLVRVYIMVVRTTPMVIAGGVGDVAAATGAVDDITLTPLLWSDPKQKRRLDAEEHAGEEKQRKAELPGANPSSQDQL